MPYVSGGGGGATLGAPVVRGPHTVGFADAAALANGVTFYTPQVGEVLLDAWVTVQTAFNISSAFLDISQFTGSGSPNGLWGWWAAVALTTADTVNLGGGPGGSAMLHNVSLATVAVSSGAGGGRVVPAVFTTTDPLQVVVSQDSTKGGAAVASNQGAASLYIVTATPAALA